LPILVFSAETHYVFDAGTVVPTAVENYNLTGSGKILHIKLKIHLALFAAAGARCSLLHIPFLSNETFDGAKPNRPSSEALGPFLRATMWNIERGIEIDGIRISLTEPGKFEKYIQEKKDSKSKPLTAEELQVVKNQLEILKPTDLFILNEFFPSWPPSSRGIHSPSPLLTLLYDFAQIRRWTYLIRSQLHAWMLRDKLNGMIEISRLKDENAAKLFLGFRIGAVGHRDFAVFPVQGHRGLRGLKRYFGSNMSVGAQMVVVLKTLV
jgi:hypothetical protein